MKLLDIRLSLKTPQGHKLDLEVPLRNLFMHNVTSIWEIEKEEEDGTVTKRKVPGVSDKSGHLHIPFKNLQQQKVIEKWYSICNCENKAKDYKVRATMTVNGNKRARFYGVWPLLKFDGLVSSLMFDKWELIEK